MLFRETGNSEMPTVILLHGGGLSYWSLSPVVELLKESYHVVTPIIDGHGEDGGTEFISIEDSAKKLLAYIDERHSGRVFAIGGLSLGAQITVEALSQKENAAQFAVVESALVIPMKGVTPFIVPIYKLSYGLISKKWFSKLQAKSMFIPDSMFDQYYDDTIKLSKQSLINITVSNEAYMLKDSIIKTKTNALIIYGEKEFDLIKKSAVLLTQQIPDSELYCAKNMKHGELSLAHPAEYVRLVKDFIDRCKRPVF